MNPVNSNEIKLDHTNSLDYFPAEILEKIVFYTNKPELTGLLSKTFHILTEDDCGKTNLIMLTILKTTGLYALLPLKNAVHVLAEGVNKQGNYKSIKMYYQISHAIHSLAIHSNVFLKQEPVLLHSDLEMYNKLNKIMKNKLSLNLEFVDWNKTNIIPYDYWLNDDGTLKSSVAEFFKQYQTQCFKFNKGETGAACLPSELEFLPPISHFMLVTDNCVTLSGENLNKMKSIGFIELSSSSYTSIRFGLSQREINERVIVSRTRNVLSLQALPINLNLSSLHTISCCGNLIVSFPSCFNKNINLTTLALNSNQLENIDLSLLENLRSIQLNYNNLTEFPRINSKYLHDLSLEGNRISEIPSNISRFTLLSNFRVGYNRLTKLPDSICDMIHLTRLNITNNLIEELPANFSNLSLNTILLLTGNPLKQAFAPSYSFLPAILTGGFSSGNLINLINNANNIGVTQTSNTVNQTSSQQYDSSDDDESSLYASSIDPDDALYLQSDKISDDDREGQSTYQEDQPPSKKQKLK